MTKFKLKPVVIEAIQLLPTTLNPDVMKFIGEEKNYPDCEVGGIDPSDGQFKLKAKRKEGEPPFDVVKIGDWIVKYPNGQYFSCTNEQFQEGYQLEGEMVAKEVFPPGFRINFAVNNALDDTTCIMYVNQKNFDAYVLSQKTEGKG